uniref:Photosystem II reaction center protein M n=1 Tax=Manoao colensoi TaxID=120598 RepID=A0A5J6CE19_MANCO|nr:photosystem II protein M [Manoao colensoi]QEQ14257.1 photosystem II protein M [Manoao colensoi]
MEINTLAFLAVTLFITVPTAFLVVLYVKTISESN